MTRPTLAEMRANLPNAVFSAVAVNSLPRNHVGFAISGDGVAYRHASTSEKGAARSFIDYESKEIAA